LKYSKYPFFAAENPPAPRAATAPRIGSGLINLILQKYYYCCCSNIIGFIKSILADIRIRLMKNYIVDSKIYTTAAATANRLDICCCCYDTASRLAKTKKTKSKRSGTRIFAAIGAQTIISVPFSSICCSFNFQFD